MPSGPETETSAAVVAELAHLVGVPVGDLAALVAQHWAGPDAAAQAAGRLEAVRNEYVRRAAQARRKAAARAQSNVREVIDEKLRANPRWTKKRAFAWLASERRLGDDTIRNAYYAVTESWSVITES